MFCDNDIGRFRRRVDVLVLYHEEDAVQQDVPIYNILAVNDIGGSIDFDFSLFFGKRIVEFGQPMPPQRCAAVEWVNLRDEQRSVLDGIIVHDFHGFWDHDFDVLGRDE